MSRFIGGGGRGGVEEKKRAGWGERDDESHSRRLIDASVINT
jgi:hypothetical protein